MNREWTHFNKDGDAVMVDVSEKDITKRTAIASGKIKVSKEIIKRVKEKTVKKGDVLSVARIAGIMGVKQTANLIPLCHPLFIQKCEITFEIEETGIKVYCLVSVEGKTGVEMEALTGVNIALLTIYDMCKAIDKRMEITDIQLEEKMGGKSGDFKKNTR